MDIADMTAIAAIVITLCVAAAHAYAAWLDRRASRRFKRGL